MNMVASALDMADLPAMGLIGVVAAQASEDDPSGTLRAIMAALLVLGWMAAFGIVLLRARQRRRAGEAKRP